jgi:hypothetical protein
MMSTGNGGLYHITGLEPETFKADFVFDFGGSAGVPVIIDRFWIQPLSTLQRISGLLTLDFTFHEPGDDRHPGVTFDREQWPHGKTGKGMPHGTVFVQ